MVRSSVLMIALVVLLAGCGGLPTAGQSQPSPPSDPTLSSTPKVMDATGTRPVTNPSPTPSPTPTASPTPTTSPTPVPPDNPWHAFPITVSVSSETDRDFRPLVERALDYWTAFASKYTDYEEIRFDLVEPGAGDADLHIHFANRIGRCSTTDGYELLGCAPYPNPDFTDGDGPTRVEVRADLTDATTVSIIEHELGHTLGLEHGDAPMPLMAAIDSDARELPVPNATEIDFPWQDRNISVYVEFDESYSDDVVFRETRSTFSPYESGMNGWLSTTPEMALVDNESAADIVIRITEESACGFENGGICHFKADGHQLDDDPGYEYYSYYEFTITQIDQHQLSDWIGYGLGFAFGAASQDDLPSQYRNPS